MNLYIKDNAIYCEIENVNQWTITKDELVFIGEYTTSGGPFVDDWFIVFSKNIDEWWQVSCYQIDEKTFWKELSELLNCELTFGLTSSTIWASSVIYPTNLQGVQLFNIVKTEVPSKTFFGKIFNSKVIDESIELTENVKELFL